MTALPLAGKRVLVTRAAHQAAKLSEGLRALGAEPVEVPVIEIRPPLDLAPLDRALRTLNSYDWLILTSANTVHALAERAASLLAGVGASIDTERGLDHGAWVPLMLMYPQADIPVLQLSVRGRAGAAHHIALGRALAPLRAEGVLILGSGGFVHNLGAIDWNGGPQPEWSRAIAGWTPQHLLARDETALADYRSRAPHAAQAHPTEEHFMPLFVAFGAGGDTVERLHSSVTFGSLRMDAYAFA